MSGEVRVRFTKWGGHRHWHFCVAPLGEDAFGAWFGGRAGIPMQRGDEPPLRQPNDVVMLVPLTGNWVAYWNPEPAVFEIYVDVATAPVRTADSISAVDLDLDVVRFRDGRVGVLDEDEFAEHQVRYGYPPEVIEQALATTDQLVAAIGARREPFGEVGARRLAEFTA